MKKFKITLTLIFTVLIFTACAEKPKDINQTEKTTPIKEETIQSKISDPYPGTDFDKISQVLENSTYLRGQAAIFMNQAKAICIKSQYELFGSIDKSNLETLDTKEMQNELERIINNSEDQKALTQQIKDFVNQNNKSEDDGISDFENICKAGKNIYVSFQPMGPAELVSLWKDKKTFEFFKDENNKIVHYGSDLAVIFLPEMLNDKNLVYVSAKDIPIYYWTFYLLDQETMKSTLIEQCELEFEYGAKNSFIMADKSELRCEKQYKLVN